MKSPEEYSKELEGHEEMLNKLAREIEGYSNETKDFFAEIGVDPKEVSDYLEDDSNFTDEGWAFLQEKQKELYEEMQREVDNVDHPERRKKALKQLQQIQGWLRI